MVHVSWRRARALAIVLSLGAVGAGAVLAQAAPARLDAAAVAKAAIANSRLPDKDGRVEQGLVKALKALPPWAPFYPGALIGLDSGTDGPGSVQVGFSTADREDKVAQFYVERLRARGAPTDTKEPGVRTIEVSNAAQTQITTIVLMPRAGGGVSGTIRHEGGGY